MGTQAVRESPFIKPECAVDVRERLMASGASRLSDTELMAAILGTGTSGKPVARLAAEILAIMEDGRSELNFDVLRKVSGMGDAKISAVAASMELGRRLYGVRGKRVTSPKDVFPLIAHFADARQERFFTVSLNGAHEVIQTRIVSAGLINRTLIHPREVFSDALTDRACAVVVAHNHPSGQLEPSAEDREVTRRLREASGIIGIPLLDHLVFSPEGYFSFVEHGILAPMAPE